MTTLIRRIIALGLAMMAVAPTLTQAPVTASAAGLTYYIDDTPSNNNGVPCPNTIGTTIQEGFNAVLTSNVTIYVCPGTYPDTAALLGSTNFKLIAKGSARLAPTAGFSGELISINNSVNFTIQGFTFDGKASLGTGNSTALAVYDSSGLIIKNTFQRWTQPDITSTNGIIHVLKVENSTVSPTNKIKIDHNTLYAFQNYGIDLYKVNGATITHNLLVASSGGDNLMWAILMTEGIGGSISGNTVRSSRSLATGGVGSMGIALSESSGVKVSANKVEMLTQAIFIRAVCPGSGSNANTISGNTISESAYGVVITASGACPSTVKGNIISGNKFVLHTTALSAIELSGFGGMVTQDTIIKGNTFSGYEGYLIVDPILGVTGTVETGSKKVDPPAPGI